MTFLAAFLGALTANIAVGTVLVVIGGSAADYKIKDKE